MAVRLGVAMKFPKKLTVAQTNLLETLQCMRLPDFFVQAACKSSKPNLFGSEHPARVAAAKRVCSSCPIVSECLTWAIDNFEDGVWGGTTKFERVVLSGIDLELDIDELAERRAMRERLETDVAIRTLAEEFEVTERTIHRWRVQIQKEAS
jgi:WhiB family redox-sensing transcriptional regulator